jgi:hypothetical protein
MTHVQLSPILLAPSYPPYNHYQYTLLSDHASSACQPTGSWASGIHSLRSNVAMLGSLIRTYDIHSRNGKLTCDWAIRVLPSHDRRYSRRFKVSIFIDPRRSVTISLALEKSHSISADIGGINRMSIAIKDKLGKLLRCASSSHHFKGSNIIITGLR